jgi:hypothetical protein
MFLGENIDFERESYLEAFIFGNPLIFAVSQDCPENLVPVYIIGRQDILKLKGKTGITDLTCLIWDPNLNLYEIWIFELKVYSNSKINVNQLKGYLDAVEDSVNETYRYKIVERAVNMVGENFINPKSKIRGALCAQSFSDDVLKEILEENSSRTDENKIIAVQIYRFPTDNDNFIFVERIVGEEKSKTGGPRNFYSDIPKWEPEILKEKLYELLQIRKNSSRLRFEQLKVFLQFFANKPEIVLTQEELRKEWKNQGLPEQDQGLSVSQVLGYKYGGALRQMLKWKMIPVTDMKQNYQLKDIKYSLIIAKVLKRFEEEWSE